MDIQKFRVACLYRVSTKMQVDGDDIPMQKTACRDFIGSMKNWELVSEYSEKGVSGYKLSAEKRDVLQQLKSDAEKKKFDILLVFMFDRLGRKEDETPFIVEWLDKKGIQVWSVKEGQQRFDNRVDKLLNYIRYWQSGGESEKTSMRVDEKHSQMVKEGIFRGGVAPYGYKLVKSGVENKKGRELKKLEIDEEESKIVRIVYRLAFEQGYGGLRIAQYLNEKGIKPRKCEKWALSVTNYMLRNPIYKGYITYGKTSYKGNKSGRQKPGDWILSDKPNEELIIISESIWNKVQLVRNIRTPERFKIENMDYASYPLQTKSPLLFIGFIKCGHCGAALSTGYSKKSWTKKDGTVNSITTPVYRCSGKAYGNLDCSGQYTYGKDKIESTVLNEVYKFLERLKPVDLEKEIAKLKVRNIEGDQFLLKRMQKDMKEYKKNLEAFENEVVNSILGKSEFKKDTLAKLINETENKKRELLGKIEKLQRVTESKKIEAEDMASLQKLIPVWKEEFDEGNVEKRKMMLAQIVSEIKVWRDKVEVNVKMSINDFIAGINDSGRLEHKYLNGGQSGLEAGHRYRGDQKPCEQQIEPRLHNIVS